MFERFVNTFPNTDSEVLQKIEQYYALLIKWNKHHNLIQKNTLDPFVFEVRHLIDCWQLSCYFSKDNAILDVGSGAGLPGILLSIAGFNVHIVEQDHNKAVFLKKL